MAEGRDTQAGILLENKDDLAKAFAEVLKKQQEAEE